MRRIVSLWLPYWPLDREMRTLAGSSGGNRPFTPPDNLSLALAPAVQVRPEQGGLRLYALNPAAEAEGLYPGMILSEAQVLIPGLRVSEADPDCDRERLGKLARWCGRYSPWVSIDHVERTAGLWFDISGCAHLFGGEDVLLDDLVRRLDGFGIEARAAVAPTPGTAWAAARYGTGTERWQIVAEGGCRTALASLPVRGLRLSDDDLDGLQKLGLNRIGDLYDIPRMTLTRRFGPALVTRLDQALGQTPEPVSPDGPEIAFKVRCTFGEAIGRVEDIEAALLSLLEDLCAIFERDRKGVRKLVMEAFRVDGGVAEVTIGTSRASCNAAHLHRLFGEKIPDIDAGFGIDAMAVSALATDVVPVLQIPLAEICMVQDRDAVSSEDLGTLVDRLGNRFGLEKIVRLKACESHLPEHAFTSAPPFGGEDEEAGQTSHRRPVRMLPAAEPVEMLSLGSLGEPDMLSWRRVPYRVTACEGPERISEEWWRTTDIVLGARRASVRDYYRVETESGHRFWLYSLGDEGVDPSADRDARWYIHGIFG